MARGRNLQAACAMGAALLLSGGLATRGEAQPAQQKSQKDNDIETVTVTAVRTPQEIIHAFVQSYAHIASSSLEEITRWKKPICAGTDGLSTEDLNLFVTGRVNQIAAEASMPVESFPCKFNIEIIFTSDPQGFLDKVRVEGPELLSPKRSQLATVAVMRHPIQAWYATGIEDRNGTLILNDEENTGYTSAAGNSGGLGVLSTVPSLNVEGSLLRTGLNSEMAHVYVIADTNKTGDLKLGPIADYIAMLALSQAQSFDECRPLPSITNLFAAGCGAALKPASITDPDIAYLRGLYKMDPGANFQTQQSAIAGEIEKAMAGKDLFGERP
jgi:hypothetical protein